MLTLNYRDSRPIYEQIKDGLRKLIVTGAMAPDEKLPSVRALAMDLAINPNTIQRAYAQLEMEGYVYSVAGRGTFVAEGQEQNLVRRREVEDKVRPLLQELRELAGSMGFSVPQAQPERTPVPDPPESEPKPVQAVFQQQPLPEPAAAMLRQAGKMDKRQEALLLALKPFLRKERQEKIDRALHAARLASLASLALKNRGRGPGAKETP